MAKSVGPMSMLASPEGTTASMRELWRHKLLTSEARQRMMRARAGREEAMTATMGAREGRWREMLEFERERLAQQGTQFGQTLGLRRELGTGELGIRKEAGALAREVGVGGLELGRERQAADIEWRAGGPERARTEFEMRDPRGAFLGEEFKRLRAGREAAIGRGEVQPGGEIGGEQPLTMRELLGLPSGGQRELTRAQTGLATVQLARERRAIESPIGQRTPEQNALIQATAEPAMARFTDRLGSLKSAWNILTDSDIEGVASSAADFASRMQGLGMTLPEVQAAIAKQLEDSMRGWARWFSGDAADMRVKDQLRRQIDAAIRAAFLGAGEGARDFERAPSGPESPTPAFGPSRTAPQMGSFAAMG